MSKILIIKLGALGDVVMATSLIKHIQAHHGNDEIWLLTAHPYEKIFECWNNLNVVVFKRSGFVNLLKTACWIRRNDFSRVYDLQSNDRTTILCGLSGSSEIVGNHPRYPYSIHPVNKYTGQCYIFDRMLEVLHCAGISMAPEPPWLPVTEQDRDFVSQWLSEHQLLQKKFVILHAGASERHPEKCWPYFPALAAELEKNNYKVIWSGSDAEKNINAKRSRENGLNAAGIFTINQLAELGRRACFAITNDSGPMHILSASKIPVYSFFGPTNWRRNHAIGQEKNIITCNDADEFAPCSLNTISLDMVIMRFRSDNLF